MSFRDCIKFANENPTCYLATTEGGQPRVRPLSMCFADDKGFCFQTQTVKAFYRQLKNSNKVEACFYLPGPESSPGKMMRVSGEIEFIDDTEIKSKIFDERPYLKDMGIKNPKDPVLSVFRIYTGEAYFWTMEYSMRESEIERIKF